MGTAITMAAAAAVAGPRWGRNDAKDCKMSAVGRGALKTRRVADEPEWGDMWRDGYVDMRTRRGQRSHSTWPNTGSGKGHRYDSLRKLDPGVGPMEDEEQLKQHPWYQAGIPREIALEILMQQEIGSFIVRDSTTHAGCYALSVKVPKFENPAGISHYLIHRTRSGVKLKGLDKEWSNLMALVTHHTVMPEMLPCTLRLPRNAANPSFNETDRDDKEEDEDYQKLSDFSTMMAELKM